MCHCVLDGHDLKKNLFSRGQIQSHKCPLIFIIVISTDYYTQEGHCCFLFCFLFFSISFFYLDVENQIIEITITI